MKTALISLNSVWEDKKANLLEIAKKLDYLKSQQVDYVVFPEMTLTGFSVNNLSLAEDIDDSETIKAFQDFAKEYELNIIFGLITTCKDKICNTCCAINSKGDVQSLYNKIHLFSYSDEHKLFNNGKYTQSISWEGGWGLSICFDLRFPELYQELSEENLILVNIANWPKQRVSHWKTLLNARAIENQSFIIGVNRVGIDGNNLEYEESSYVFSPEGMALIPEVIEGDIKIFDINIQHAIDYRTKFSIKKDRQPTLYKTFYDKAK